MVKPIPNMDINKFQAFFNSFDNIIDKIENIEINKLKK